MIYHLSTKSNNIKGSIEIGGSKSESNRLLILRAYTYDFKIENLSESDDTKTLINALISNDEIIDVNHAGTAMRFLLSYFVSKPNSEVILTGSDRMKSRPIRVLVNALRDLGANIEYKNKDGYPPLKIIGKKILKNEVSLPADVSSQYVSSLMMLGLIIENGIKLKLEGIITSKPYILMTKELIQKIGYNVKVDQNYIQVSDINKCSEKTIIVESDTIYMKDYIIIKKNKNVDLPKKVKLDLSDTPDLAQTIAVSCLGLGIECELTGLHTLKIKETDRLEALKKEFNKLGANQVKTFNNSIYFKGDQQLSKNIKISTYQDHRMALSFATLAVIIDISIESPNVVSKSFPSFWQKLKELGFKIN